MSTRSKGAFTRRLAAAAQRWIAPHCTVCGVTRGEPVCAPCSNDFFSADVPRCQRCALRLPTPATGAGSSTSAGATLCPRCLRDPPQFDATITLGDYTPPLDGLIAALKFGHRLELAGLFGRLLAARTSVDGGNLLIPVPLAFERQSARGFNQAQEIARIVAHELQLPLACAVLLRIRHAAPQESLGLEARRHNVRGAFAVCGDVRDRAVTIIDDVMTSGSTLDEVAGTLKNAGATRVTNLVLARTP